MFNDTHAQPCLFKLLCGLFPQNVTGVATCDVVSHEAAFHGVPLAPEARAAEVGQLWVNCVVLVLTCPSPYDVQYIASCTWVLPPKST